MNRLKGRIICVTGGSRGIGLAIASACARDGAQLILVARDGAALAAAARTTPASATFRSDVTREAEVERLFRGLRRKFKRLDVLVNNAGVFTYKPFARTTPADWNKNIATNLTSLYLVTRAALPLLKRSAAPQIINILSVASRTAFPNCSAYCASKFGALGLTRVLADELRPLGIRVTGVLPGATSTRQSSEFGFPVNRSRLLEPEDAAQAVLAALVQPPRGTMDEILLTPSHDNLSPD